MRGRTIKKVAEAECRQFRARTELTARLTAPRGELRSPLEKRLAIFTAALPRATKILDEARRLLDASVGTAPLYDAIVLKVEDLRQAIQETQEALASAVPELASPDSLDSLLVDVKRSASDWSEASAKQRRTMAFNISVRAGYDEILEVDQLYPVMAGVMFEFTPGWFAQRSADVRAAQGYQEFVNRQGADARAQLDLQHRELRALDQSAATRRTELDALCSDLRQRISKMRAVPGSEGARYADQLWFASVRCEADQAYLEERSAALARAQR